MGVLEQVTEMKNQGIPEDEIVNKLQEKGISPKAINDALGQSNIKTAVSGEREEEIEPSIRGETPPEPPATKQSYASSAQEIPEYETGNQIPSSQEKYYPPQEEYYPEEGSGGYEGYGGYGAGGDTDTFIEIAEQVFSEKIKEIQEQLEEFTEFKSLAQIKLDHATERVKKIESTMDKLQMAILEKIGSYGRNLESIKKEMSMMQGSFGKMVGKIATRHHAPVHKKPVTRKKVTKKRKKTASKRRK